MIRRNSSKEVPIKFNRTISIVMTAIITASFVACAHRAPRVIPPMSQFIGEMPKLGCECKELTKEQQEHIIAIGDELLVQILTELNACRHAGETPVEFR